MGLVSMQCSKETSAKDGMGWWDSYSISKDVSATSNYLTCVFVALARYSTVIFIHLESKYGHTKYCLGRYSTVAVKREWKYCHIILIKSSIFWLLVPIIFKRYFSMSSRYFCFLFTFFWRVVREGTDRDTHIKTNRY